MSESRRERGERGFEPVAPAGPRVSVADLVERHRKECPSLKGRRISLHSFRHTTAMHLLQSGVDIAVIALWLGHEKPTTTHLYVEADLEM
jgi:integrase/recombinase XerD